MLRLVLARLGGSGLGTARLGWHGRLGELRRGELRRGKVRFGRQGGVWPVVARMGLARLGRHCSACHGKAGVAPQVQEWHA